jgi:hypothetical protein
MPLWRDRESDVSSGQMALRTQYSPPGCPKVKLLGSRKSDVSKGRNSTRNLFLPSGHPKIRVGRGRGSDVSCCGMALWNHYLPYGWRKMRVFVKGIERNFKWWKGPKISFPAFWPPQITTWLKLIKRCFMVSTHSATGLFAFWQTQNATLARSSNRFFKGCTRPENSSCVLRTSQNKTCIYTIKRCNNVSIGHAKSFSAFRGFPKMRLGSGRGSGYTWPNGPEKSFCAFWI